MTALILLKDFLETQIELWLPVAGFDGYDVSNLGQVRSWRTHRWMGYGRGGIRARRETPLILKASPKDTGRLHLTLCTDDGKYVNRQVHLLVGRAFLPNPNNLPQLNHKTGIYTDNRAANLEWISRQGNIDHAVEHGLWPHGERMAAAKLTDDGVREIRKRHALGETNLSISLDFNVSKTCIAQVVRGNTWRHVI